MNRLTLLFLSMAIAVSMLLLHQTGRLAPVEDGAFTVFGVLQQPVAAITSGIENLVGTVTTLGDLRAENARLKAQVDELTREVITLRASAQEVQQLKERLGVVEKSSDMKLLYADIIGWSPVNVNQTFKINRGSEDGVEEGMNVITGSGLVGRVTKVYTHYSQVLLLIDSNSAVNAIIQSSQQDPNTPSNATGIVQGQGISNNQFGNQLVMRYIEQTAQVHVNDTVVTSGIGGYYMRGLAIGRIKSVKRSDVDLVQEAEVEPVVDFGRIDHVFVILNFRPTKLD